MRTARSARIATASLAVLLVLGACSDDGSDAEHRPQSPQPPTTSTECGDFRIAFDPNNGYEASAFIVGEIAELELDCDVTYLPTRTRDAWRMVAAGDADVYLDAYGNTDLRGTFARRGGPIRIVGPNGIAGAVDLLAPYFMGENGLESFRDLEDDDIGWDSVTPAITTVPELVPLARQFVDNVGLDYIVRDYVAVGAGEGMGDLIQQVDKDDAQQQPALYLAAAPRPLLGDGGSRVSVELPDSAGEGCEPVASATLCSLRDFRYLKIANAEFAESGSPAYALVFAYQLSRSEVANVMELVELSGYDVRAADVVSWINTHRDVWS
ncbi:MAG: glycine betaine ABC transporter substrate-binding protein, partial [Nocardioidaceae bacterium]